MPANGRWNLIRLLKVNHVDETQYSHASLNDGIVLRNASLGDFVVVRTS